jgi:hypothetical protein
MTRLIAQKGFIDARRREGFRSYIFWNKWTITCGQHHLRKMETTCVNKTFRANGRRLEVPPTGDTALWTYMGMQPAD